MLTCDEYLTPRSLDEAFAAMARNRGRYRIVAGCTDTLPWAREGRAGDVEIPVLIDVVENSGIAANCASTTAACGSAPPRRSSAFSTIPRSRRALPCMPRCAVWFADDQIRAQATIGGNIVNASPAADATPCLIAHEAEVELAKSAGGKIARRRMKLDQFVTGPNRTALADGELLVAVECDALAGLWRQLREGRPPPLAGDFARLPRGRWSSSTRRAANSRTCGSPSPASARCRCG